MPKVAANIGPLVVGAVATLYRGYDLCAAEEDLETKREEEREIVEFHSTSPLPSPPLSSRPQVVQTESDLLWDFFPFEIQAGHNAGSRQLNSYRFERARSVGP